ncbi:MAG: lipoprotein-releasing system transmembrane subunit, LolC/LolE family [Desulfuromonas sp.]|nr:MAG: lipoprotein-releasing system transmembrane subunit, LolC/LolE family [Desulfuromonas sp.]
MGYELFVSLRYLRAKRKQTFISVISFISIAGVTLGVAALIVVLAVMTGFHDGVRQQILGNVPHVVLQRHGSGLAGQEQIVKEIRSLSPYVVDVAPFVSREAMLLARQNVAAVNVKGIAPGHKVLAQEFVSQGGIPVGELLFDKKEGRPGIVVSTDTATTLGVAIGDTINVIPPDFTITPFGMIPKLKPFKIVAISTTGSSILDNFVAYVALDEAQRFFGLGDKVSGIEIDVDRFDHARPVASLVRQEYGYPYLTRSWEDLFGSFLAALKLEKLGLFIVLGIIVLVAAFNIATTLIMVVMEKTKDIAVLRSLGATSRSILKIFLFEGLIIGVVGTGLGTVIGLLLAKNADPIIKGIENQFHIKLFDKNVYGMEHFPSVVHSSDVIAVVVVALLISLFATLYPAWHAARMDPAEALRYE